MRKECACRSSACVNLVGMIGKIVAAGHARRWRWIKKKTAHNPRIPATGKRHTKACCATYRPHAANSPKPTMPVRIALAADQPTPVPTMSCANATDVPRHLPSWRATTASLSRPRPRRPFRRRPAQRPDRPRPMGPGQPEVARYPQTSIGLRRSRSYSWWFLQARASQVPACSHTMGVSDIGRHRGTT